MEITGTFVKQLESKEGTGRNGNAWIKREFVLLTPGQYGKEVAFQVFNDKGDIVEGLTEGEEITVSFDLESREYNNKYYTQVNAFKITSGRTGASSGGGSRQAVPAARQPAPRQPEPQQAPAFKSAFDDDSNDLPF